jgi:hypothetical protein
MRGTRACAERRRCILIRNTVTGASFVTTRSGPSSLARYGDLSVTGDGVDVIGDSIVFGFKRLPVRIGG